MTSGLPDSGFYRIQLHLHTLALGPDDLADRMLFHLPPHTRLHIATANNEKHEAFLDVEVYGQNPAESFNQTWSAVVNLGTALRMEQGLDVSGGQPRLIEARITPAINAL